MAAHLHVDRHGGGVGAQLRRHVGVQRKVEGVHMRGVALAVGIGVRPGPPARAGIGGQQQGQRPARLELVHQRRQGIVQGADVLQCVARPNEVERLVRHGVQARVRHRAPEDVALQPVADRDLQADRPARPAEVQPAPLPEDQREQELAVLVDAEPAPRAEDVVALEVPPAVVRRLPFGAVQAIDGGLPVTAHERVVARGRQEVVRQHPAPLDGRLPLRDRVAQRQLAQLARDPFWHLTR